MAQPIGPLITWCTEAVGGVLCSVGEASSSSVSHRIAASRGAGLWRSGCERRASIEAAECSHARQC